MVENYLGANTGQIVSTLIYQNQTSLHHKLSVATSAGPHEVRQVRERKLV